MPDLELHIPGMHFCGPGTKLDQRIDPNTGKPKPSSMPVDRIDEAALKHDIFYAKHSSTKERLKADKQMLDEINSITNPTCRESVERVIVNLALRLKSFVTYIFLRFVSILTGNVS